MMPPDAMEAVTLNARGSIESAATDVPWASARRCKATSDDLLLSGATIGQIVDVWELYKINETTDPNVGDAITDEDSVVCQIANIQRNMIGTVFRCQCIRNK